MMNWDSMNGWMGAWMWIPAAVLVVLVVLVVVVMMRATAHDDRRAPRS